MDYKKQFFFACSVSIVALALFVGEFLLIRDGRARLVFILEEVSALERERKALETIRSLAGRTAGDRAILHEKFIPVDGAVAFLKRIEALGKRSETTFSVETLKASVVSPEASFEDVELRFTAEGTFQNIVYLLALIESLPTAVTITSVRLDASSAGDGGVSLWRAIVFLHTLKERDGK